MRELIRLVIEIEAAEWENIKKRSGLASDELLLSFLYRAGERMFEAIERNAAIFEIIKGGMHREICLADLFQRYALDDLIQQVESGNTGNIIPNDKPS